MSLKRFLKQHKKVKENTTYPATKSLTDENGNPLLWTIRALTTKENDEIREDCTIEVPVKGKPNVYRNKFNSSKYVAKMIVASVVEPNLYDKELQDSYGVMTPEELLKEMVDNPSEYQDFATFVQEYCGFDTSMEEKVEEAKN
ncbi:MAG: hypothetical protein IAC13_07505 [Firmicutes bacterium]|uniref:Phage portal protein n=1 Tax=Candidatus Scybalomonas excrementavium TaxID=2840943 RepID=A0A9D9N853_9FIRM|nr:hypothetical protein [Candidatus Scybalomonas excrementavium]